MQAVCSGKASQTISENAASLPDFIRGYTLAGRSRKEGDFEGMPSSDPSFDAQFLVKYCSGNHPI